MIGFPFGGITSFGAMASHIPDGGSCLVVFGPHVGVDSTGKVGTVGFCLGGLLAYIMATESDADCNVAYYGVGIDARLDAAKNIKSPTILHIAEEDGFVPKDAQAKIKEALKGHPKVTIHSYPGVDHAFARNNGVNYNKAAAQLAETRTLACFKANLA